MNNDEHLDATEGGDLIEFEITQPEEIVETPPKRQRHRRWWLPYVALAGVLAAGGGGLYAAHWATQRHRNALEQQAVDLADIVVKKAGSGSEVFDFGADARSLQLTLVSPTTFYMACSAGQAVIGPYTHTCNGKIAVYGPYGAKGTVLDVSLPNSPWAIIARPSDQGVMPPTVPPSASHH